MIKLLFMIPTLGQGGAEKVLVNLVNNLDISQFDITVQTLFDEGENKQFLKSNIHYKSYMNHQFRGNTHYFKLFSPRSLYKRIVKDDYDIIVSYLEGPTARIVSGCTNPKTKLISWIHGEQQTKKNAASSFRNYKEAMSCYSAFHRTICVSDCIKDDFLSFFPLENPISVLYNTNETKLIRKLGKEDIDISIDNGKCINICAIGTLKKIKGFDRLIRVIDRLCKDNLSVRLYILGKGPMYDELLELVKELKVEDNIIFLGYQTNPYKYVSKMDIFTCSSYTEGFSTAATEALILGIPVVTVLVSGMQEMLGYNNEYGIVTKNDEEELYLALKDIIMNKEKLMYYKDKAKERGSFFSAENTVKAVEEMLIQLLNQEELL